MENRALQQEPRYEPAKVLPMSGEPSMLEWLATNNRLMERDPEEKWSEVEEEGGEIADLMGGDDDFYEVEDDDDFELADEDED